MATYAGIQADIQRLRREAEALRAKEVAKVIERAKAAIEMYGLTATDLFEAGQSVASRPESAASAASVFKKRPPSPMAGVPVSIKYRDATGNAWSGRGSKPRWLVAALAEGKALEDFAV